MVSQDDVNQYNVQADSADHVSEYCRIFIPEKELKESILCEHPVSNNIEGVNRLDNFMRDIEKGKKRSNELLVENILFLILFSLKKFIVKLWMFMAYWP